MMMTMMTMVMAMAIERGTQTLPCMVMIERGTQQTFPDDDDNVDGNDD